MRKCTGSSLSVFVGNKYTKYGEINTIIIAVCLCS